MITKAYVASLKDGPEKVNCQYALDGYMANATP